MIEAAFVNVNSKIIHGKCKILSTKNCTLFFSEIKMTNALTGRKPGFVIFRFKKAASIRLKTSYFKGTRQ
jgi:hypothetical protein